MDQSQRFIHKKSTGEEDGTN